MVSITNSHIHELCFCGFSAACLSGGNIDEKGIEQGDYSFIFTSPESVIRNEKWPKMLRTNVYKERLFGLVTDEAHVIPKCMSFTVYVYCNTSHKLTLYTYNVTTQNIIYTITLYKPILLLSVYSRFCYYPFIHHT